MTDADTLEKTQDVNTNTPDLVHWICGFCYQDLPAIAMCGYEITKYGVAESADCVVCEDLVDKPCEVCGK
jgi:hypothetical protein